MYARKIEKRELTFGVSGLLYRSNVLMYDHQSESLWSQVKRQAISGPLAGKKLRVLPSRLTSWKKWRKRHPDSEVLSLDTGYARDYTRDPYADYYQSRRGMFSRFFSPGPGEEEKELVVGVEWKGEVRAYPLNELRQTGSLSDTWPSGKLSLSFNPASEELLVQSGKETIPHMVVYWFVWKGIHARSPLIRTLPVDP